ncbi:hypothetical protein [Sphingomonas sp. 1185]|uniref:hypothetical protein n=1 Tax=Sphingomonas sp. 1185 TaxID=3156411 RepID=UPI00339081AF
MADRVFVKITIGGALPRSRLQDLLTVVANEGLSLDHDDEELSIEDHVANEPLTLMAHEVAWGRFDQLESFCQKLGLAFVRSSGGYAGSFGPVRVVFAGWGQPVSYLITEEDELVFDLAALRKLGSMEAIEAQAGEAAFEPGPLVIVDTPVMEPSHG